MQEKSPKSVQQKTFLHHLSTHTRELCCKACPGGRMNLRSNASPNFRLSPRRPRTWKFSRPVADSKSDVPTGWRFAANENQPRGQGTKHKPFQASKMAGGVVVG